MNETTKEVNMMRERAEKRLFNNMIAEIKEEAKQQDAPIYKGDNEVDLSISLSSMLAIIEKYSTN